MSFQGPISNMNRSMFAFDKGRAKENDVDSAVRKP